MTDKHFIDWENHVFGYGYGSGEPLIIPAIRAFFDQLNENRYDYTVMERAFGKLAAWLLINTLNRADLVEYGTSPRFGWLTPKGEVLRDYMQARTIDDLVRVVTESDDSHIHCDPDLCQCDEPCRNPLF